MKSSESYAWFSLAFLQVATGVLHRPLLLSTRETALTTSHKGQSWRLEKKDGILNWCGQMLKCLMPLIGFWVSAKHWAVPKRSWASTVLALHVQGSVSYHVCVCVLCMCVWWTQQCLHASSCENKPFLEKTSPVTLKGHTTQDYRFHLDRMLTT